MPGIHTRGRHAPDHQCRGPYPHFHALLRIAAQERAHAAPDHGVGLLAGVINGASANGGPPIILFFLSSPLGAAVGRASLIAFFLFTDVWASLFYWQQGLISLDTIIFTLVFMVPMFGGMWFGNRWFSTVDEARFRKVVLALLMIISVVGLVKAL